MADEPFDVVIVGAGPAGATAAILLAKKGRRVALVDRATFPRNSSVMGWLNVDCEKLLAELGLDVSNFQDGAFRDVVFYRADFERCAKPTFRKTAGFLIDRSKLTNTLVDTARRRRVKLFPGVTVTDLRLLESGVEVQCTPNEQSERCKAAGTGDGDHAVLRGRLLLFAAGRGSALLNRLGVTVGRSGLRVWTAEVEAPITKSLAPPRPQVAVVVGLDERGSFGMCCVARNRAFVSVNWLGDEAETPAQLVRLCSQAFERRVVPVDLSKAAPTARVIGMPGSAALEMDSHVGKHTLVIGEAGGFVAAASNEGIYPAMWSAQIAAEVVDEALESEHSQDELITFNTRWRVQMGDFLRPPHSDLQFFLPLVFSNQPMADRMGAAFFRGENL